MRQDGPLGLGQDGPGPSCPNPLYNALIVIVGDKVVSGSFQVGLYCLYDMIKHGEMLYGVLNTIAYNAKQAINMAVLLFPLLYQS